MAPWPMRLACQHMTQVSARTARAASGAMSLHARRAPLPPRLTRPCTCPVLDWRALLVLLRLLAVPLPSLPAPWRCTSRTGAALSLLSLPCSAPCPDAAPVPVGPARGAGQGGRRAVQRVGYGALLQARGGRARRRQHRSVRQPPGRTRCTSALATLASGGPGAALPITAARREPVGEVAREAACGWGQALAGVRGGAAARFFRAAAGPWDFQVCTEQMAQEQPYFPARGGLNDMFFDQVRCSGEQQPASLTDACCLARGRGPLHRTFDARCARSERRTASERGPG